VIEQAVFSAPECTASVPFTGEQDKVPKGHAARVQKD
jgi:hypothetical protein